MRRLLFFLVLVLLVPVAKGQQSSGASSLLLEGDACLARGDYETGAHRFEEAYNWEPTLQAAFGAGVCHFKLRRFSEAELWFQKALRLDPDDQQAAVYLASSQIANYKPAQAVALLEDFVKEHPDAVDAASTLKAIRADLRPRSFSFEGRNGNNLYLAAAAAVFLLLCFGSLLLPDAGLRAMGRGLGWSALTSLLLLFALPAILALLGYLWSVSQCFRGWQEHRYLKGKGSWARMMRSDLFRVAGLFAVQSEQFHERHLLPVLKGLVKAGLAKSIVREVEVQLQTQKPDRFQAEAAVQKFSRAGRRLRLEILRLSVSMAAEVGWHREQEQLLTDIARKLQLLHALPSLLAELGLASEKEERAGAPHGLVAPSQPDPLLAYFKILEVPPHADRSGVKSGYRRQARRYHPDVMRSRSGAAVSGAQFHKIREAYQEICKARGWEE